MKDRDFVRECAVDQQDCSSRDCSETTCAKQKTAEAEYAQAFRDFLAGRGPKPEPLPWKLQGTTF
jgi:hypothetical protein